MFLLSLLGAAVPLVSNRFGGPALLNNLVQLTVFVLTAMIPGLVTGRMSYVDIAWPWGLVSIGLMPLMSGGLEQMELRTGLIMMAYLVAGLRMGMGALAFFFKGLLQKEFPRYLYVRRVWAEQGITDESSLAFKITLQKEILVQALANMGGLCIPMLLQAYGYKTGPLTSLELAGWALWLAGITFEHTADKQKKAFIADCAEKKIKNAVCDVGLWRYSRHPNYFGEWMVWNSLIITSLPSLIALWQTQEEALYVKIGLTWDLVIISYMMYQCLVNYTGAKPAEFYTVQKRPAYKKYQKMVNMFVPGPRRNLKD